MITLVPSIQNNRVNKVLRLLHEDSKYDGIKMMKAMGKSIFKKLEPEDAKKAYLPISEEQGKYIYNLIVKKDFKTVVEFGTSFGISTLYLAAAMQQTEGRVVTTEIVPEKCAQALENFKNAGLEEYIELRKGDATKTLANWNEPIDLLLLDGWKDLYFPVFDMLKDSFHSETVIFVDNSNFAEVRAFLNQVKEMGDYTIYDVPVSNGSSAIIKLK